MSRLLYRFGECSVDLAARELRRAGDVVTLSPKVFDTLAYLISHRDRAIGRDELIAAVWGRADVTDALLGQVMLKARRAVGDTGDEQNAIRTIPRFGYRWVAEVQVEERMDSPNPGGSIAPVHPAIAETETPAATGNDAAQKTEPHTPEPDSRRRLRRIAIAGALVVLGIIATVVVAVLLGHRAPPSLPAQSSRTVGADVIAVLPVVVDAGPEWAWLRFGLMDLISTRLHAAGMAVVPDETMVALTRATSSDALATATDVRAATGARRVLVSSASHAADGWHVHVELRDAEAGDIKVETRQADAAAATRAAVAQLLVRLGKPVGADLAAEPSTREDIKRRAYAALLSGEFDSVRRIVDTAPAEVRNDPELRLRLAQVDLGSGQAVAARRELDRLLVDVKAEVDPALRALVLTVSSSVRLQLGDPAAALRDCSEAITLVADGNEPGALGRAYTACGIAEAVAGHFDEAMNNFAPARVALSITGDALSLARIEANEGVLENTRGRYAEGLAIMRKAEERFRRLGGRAEVLMAIHDQVDAQLALLQPLEALATSERGWALLPQADNADLRGSLQVQHARALAANGRLGEAAALLVKVVDGVTPGQELALLGDARAEQARIELMTGRVETAAEHARIAVDALAAPDRARARASAWLTRVRALRGNDAAAESRRFMAWSATVPLPAAAAFATLAQAELQWAAQREAALAGYEHALAQAEQAGVPADIVEVAVSWGNVLIEAGSTERASVVVGRVQRWADTDFPSSLVQARLYRALGQEEAWRAALQRARRLAGERPIPPSVEPGDLAQRPSAVPTP